MYSTKLIKTRHIVSCISVLEGVKRVIDLLVDTGALYTCCNYRFINPSLKEADFCNAEHKEIGGIVDGETLKLYRLDLLQFTIGSIDLGKQSIWISFDNRISDCVLGMDILKEVDFIHFASSNNIIFFKNQNELIDFISKPADLAASFNDYINNK